MLESYQGPKKVIGVFLSAAYMVSKGTDLMGCVKLWWTASYKLLQNVVSSYNFVIKHSIVHLLKWVYTLRLIVLFLDM